MLERLEVAAPVAVLFVLVRDKPPTGDEVTMKRSPANGPQGITALLADGGRPSTVRTIAERFPTSPIAA
jgi:hypothetical protein